MPLMPTGRCFSSGGANRQHYATGLESAYHRSLPSSSLTTFFQLKHCKPLFKQQNILAFKNLYTYHTFMEVFKILKLRCPTSLNQHYQLSSRKETTLIAQLPSNDFISRSTKIWSTIAPKLKLFDYSYKISLAKSRLKKSLLKLQHAYNDSALTSISSDYDIMQLSFENNPLQKI